MKDKFKMSQDENIFIAKRMLIDSVYKIANLEGINITFKQTIDILNDVNVDNIKPSEIGKVFSLRDAWHYIIENIKKIDLAFLEEVHQFVTKTELDYRYVGTIRVDDVLISGTSWRPEIPIPKLLHTQLIDLLKIVLIELLSIMLWIMRNQIFKDGNKRVAILIANKILIENGYGIISIPVELDGTFKSMLVNYYETNDMTSLKIWLYDNCID